MGSFRMTVRLILAILFAARLYTAIAQASSPRLFFYGRLLYDTGESIPGARVQFWHTDVNGRYDHPSDSSNDGLSLLLPDFQYFGTDTTKPPDGSFSFVTYRPGLYGTRPTHIHFKVWLNGTDGILRDVLTSQFYFADENTSFSSLLQLELVEQDDGTLVTNKTIVLQSTNTRGGASLPVTPTQPQGPFYPVVDFHGLDNDLTRSSHLDTTTIPPSGDPPSPSSSSTSLWSMSLLLTSLAITPPMYYN